MLPLTHYVMTWFATLDEPSCGGFGAVSCSRLDIASVSLTLSGWHVCLSAKGHSLKMADSGEENAVERPAKRQKRFTFQRLSQRVAQVRKHAMTLAVWKRTSVIAVL